MQSRQAGRGQGKERGGQFARHQLDHKKTGMGDNLRSSSVGDFIGDLNIHRKEERLAHESSGDLARRRQVEEGGFFLAG